jgi:hypothetical protein
MKEYKVETIVVERDGWEFLKNKSRTDKGFSPLTKEQLDRSWERDDFKNGGGKKYPIADNEIRISYSSFNIRWDTIKDLLTENGFKWRQDGFCFEEISIF